MNRFNKTVSGKPLQEKRFEWNVSAEQHRNESRAAENQALKRRS